MCLIIIHNSLAKNFFAFFKNSECCPWSQTMLTSVLIVLKWQQINFFPVGDCDSNDNVDKKSIKEIETTVYGDSVYIDFPRSWRPLIVEPISKNSMMVAQLKTQKRTKRKTMIDLPYFVSKKVSPIFLCQHIPVTGVHGMGR